MARSVDGLHPRHAEIPFQVRLQEGGDEAAAGAVHVYRYVQALLVLEAVQGIVHIFHRFVTAVEGAADDNHHGHGVLITELQGFRHAQMVAALLHGDEAGLDIPVDAELLPADLDVDTHDHVGSVRRFALGLPPFAPILEQCHAAQHRRFTGADGGCAHGLLVLGGVPQPGDDVDAARFDIGRLRILVLVDHVLVEGLGHQPHRFRLHPGGNEGRQVQPGVAVQHQFIMDDVEGRFREHLILRHLVFGHT
ncbi:hypothetical protein BMS3Abin01_00635 [bacterium BMS3Abin01]|nr:hypothetical protein BMS3Abin01_00635 [bacterium BMS3Abin01]